MRLPCLALALVAAAAAFRVGPARSPASRLGASSLQPYEGGPPAPPPLVGAARGRAARARGAPAGGADLITATEAVVLPLTAILAGSALLAFSTINEMAVAQ